MTFGEKIKEARLAKGWTQAELGEKVGVTKQAITAWETGHSRPRKKLDVESLSQVLDISVDYLMLDDLNKSFDQRLKSMEKELISVLEELKKVKRELTILKQRVK